MSKLTSTDKNFLLEFESEFDPMAMLTPSKDNKKEEYIPPPQKHYSRWDVYSLIRVTEKNYKKEYYYAPSYRTPAPIPSYITPAYKVPTPSYTAPAIVDDYSDGEDNDLLDLLNTKAKVKPEDTNVSSSDEDIDPEHKSWAEEYLEWEKYDMEKYLEDEDELCECEECMDEEDIISSCYRMCFSF